MVKKVNKAIESFREVIEGGRKLERTLKENKKLKDQLKETTEQLEQARKVRGLVLPPRSKSKDSPKVFGRLIFGDTHGSHAQTDAIAAMLKDMEMIDVREIVMLGDHMECGGWMMQSHTLGYVAQMDEVVYEEDVAATNDLLDRLTKVAPNADIHYIEGNHEMRMERWCVNAVEGNRRNAEYLMRSIAPQYVLSLKDRGIPYYKMDGQHSGLNERGILKLGKSYFTHGFSTAKHAASKHVDKFAGCVFYGHTHRADYCPTRLVQVGLVAAWCPGCLCDLAPRWKHNDPTSWTHGYILQIINKDDDTFHAMHVPIDKGMSYLNSLIKTIS